MKAEAECSVFVGVSLEGFIARANGDLDWLMGDGESDGGDHGYNEFIAGIDTIVMGRKTFEKVLTFDKWYYGGKRVAVLSNHPLDLSLARDRGGTVELMGGSPAEIVSKLAASGARRLYVDGGITIQQFLCAGLIRTCPERVSCTTSGTPCYRRSRLLWLKLSRYGANVMCQRVLVWTVYFSGEHTA